MAEKINLKEIDEAIAALKPPIEALHERLQRLGAEAAFNTEDPETSPLFSALWAASFDRGWSAEKQEAILKEMSSSELLLLKKMREVSHLSEIEMEKGYCRDALKEARALPSEHFYKNQKSPAASTRTMLQLMANEENPNDYIDLLHQRIQAQFSAIEKLTQAFPYHTYQTLSHGERLLLNGLGYDINAQHRGTHLIIEAGALPFSALFSSIARLGGPVIATISDKASYDLATEFLDQLGEKGIIDRASITLLHKTPEQIADIPFPADHPPYAATVTQLVQPAARVEKAMRALTARNIDTIITRGANGLSALLYEPHDTLAPPRRVPLKYVAAPHFTALTETQAAAEGGAVNHRGACYNTSHVFSSRNLAVDAELPQKLDFFFSEGRTPHGR